MTVVEARKQLGFTEQTYCRRRKTLGVFANSPTCVLPPPEDEAAKIIDIPRSQALWLVPLTQSACFFCILKAGGSAMTE